MLDYCSPKCIARNMGVVAEYGCRQAMASGNLRIRYLTALNQIQRKPFSFSPIASEILVDCQIENPCSRSLHQHFMMFGDYLDEAVAQSFTLIPEEEKHVKTAIAAALDLLEAYDTRAASAVQMLVGCILVSQLMTEKEEGSASIEDTLGVIWLGPAPSWTIVDYAEHLLHEATHQAQFLDEMVNPMFLLGVRLMDLPKYLVTSPIWEVPRRYDVSFHAAAVAATIADFYLRIDRPKKAQEFLATLQITLKELVSKPLLEIFTPHGMEVLEELRRHVTQTAALVMQNGGE